MRQNKQREGSWLAPGLATILIVAFMLLQPGETQAQCNWVPGSGTITLTCGNVGIGTTGPNRLLHIRDTASTVFTGTRVSVLADSSDPVYELLHETANKGFRWRLGDSSNSSLFLDYTTDGFNSFTPYLTALSNGKFGIGTINPLYNLDVSHAPLVSSIRFGPPGDSGGFLTSTAPDQAIISGGAAFDGANWRAKHATAELVHMMAGTVSFYTNTGLTANNAFTPTERFRVDPLGATILGSQLVISSAAAPTASIEIGANSTGNRFGFIDITTDSTYTDFGLRLIRDNTGANANANLSHRGTGNLYVGAVDAGQVILQTTNADRLAIAANGNVGIGTSNPWLKLNVWGGRAHVASAAEAYAIGVGRTDTAGAFWLGSSSAAAPDLIFSNTGGTERVRITDAGRLGIGIATPSTPLHVVGAATITGAVATGTLSVSGNITATGSIAATYQDVAEWVPATRAIPAGSVVTIDPEHSNQVLTSSQAYDTRVAGVVSARPGVILGEAGEGKVMVATTGRVRVKVDATRGPIRVGDLLVTSDKEGIAMRSQPLDLGGTPIHRPGTIIGKALEPLNNGVGEILVLLSLQ